MPGPAVAAETSVPVAVRDALAELLGPFDSEPPGGVVVRLNKAEGIYREGDAIAFEVTPPEQPVHIYLDYYQSDGNVVHLLPAPGAAAPRHETGRPILLGQADDAVQFEILPPFGAELIVVIAAPRPLVPPRQEFEQAAPYQEALKLGIAQLRSRGEADRISVQVLPVSTYAKDAEIPLRTEVAALPPPEPQVKSDPPAPKTPEPEAPEPQVEAPEPSALPQAPRNQTPEPTPEPKVAEPTPVPAAEPPKVADRDAGPGSANGATEPEQTAALPPKPKAAEDETDSVFKARIRRHLNRLRQAPGDEENLADLIDAYQDYAGSLIERDELPRANRQLEMALALDPLNETTAVLIQNAENRAALRENLEAAEGYLEAKDYDLAYEALERIRNIEPSHPLANEKLPEIRDQAIKQFHRRAMTAFRREELDRAITLWDKLLVIEPKHQRATMYRSLALDLKSRLQELETQ